MAPPLYRNRPTWYQQGLAQVASRFSTVLSSTQPANLFLLPSFVCQDLSPDGIHLSVVSGLHYVLHIFDQSVAILALDPREPELKLVKVQEAVRHHDDRYLESRHGSLHGQVSLKVAVDSEFKDWVTNRSEEDWMTIIGLPRLGQMTPREWQVAARKQVTHFLKDVLSANRTRIEFSVMYVGNPVRHRPTGNTVYNVRLNSVAASERIREIYSGFFSRRKSLPLPQDFKGISVRNKVTLATRVRIRILQQFASNYLASNPGATVNVKGYDSRPQLTLTPPRGSTSRQRGYNFIEACTMLPAVFSDDGLAQIFQVVGAHFQGELRALFVVLSDDDRERCENLAKNYHGRARQAAPPSRSGHFSGAVSGAGTGMDVQSHMLDLLRSQPPPPPPRSSSLAPRQAETRSRAPDSEDRHDPKSQRGLKRGHQDDRGDRDAKRHKQSRRTPSPPSSSSSDSSPPRRRKKPKKQKKTKTSKRKSRRRQSSSSSSTSSSSSSTSSSPARVSEGSSRSGASRER